MPELPEVETIVRGLTPELTARRITSVLVRDGRLRTPIAPDFATALSGRRIQALRRHGKFMLTELDDGRLWLVHLGMSGRLTLAPSTRPDRLHDHVVLRLDDDRLVTYNDPRRFGRLAVIDATSVAAETVAGVDALSDELTAAHLFAVSRRRRTSVKALLMDQRLVAGLGNIYVSEILFLAGIRPRRAAGRLRAVDCDVLLAATRSVLADAIARGGSSISDYRDGFDGFGSYQDHHQVYGRKDEPCHRCGAPIRSIVVTGRSTFWCANCQR
ncbi:MAG TPA: bifunctional DNA-formamidopyrimidine glycosylase/DNA-(apurinic or apyrimidinic site) lyase [Candidatus Binatia bacterium]|jgi:formamidopyrimidine-DNA glycosylase|nr:bifunctional DNA-formamidopyrimidine glycosylase/DNA-(apurinic or apyrimidinic site) lyase [Candidatus Binatia bacterium]